jgi:hypothetical protein
VKQIAVFGAALVGACLLAGVGLRGPEASPRDDAGTAPPPAPVVPPAPLAPPAALRPASPGDCVEVVCGRLPSATCHEDEQLRVAQMCANQYSGECIVQACQRLGPLACTTLDAIARIAPSCRTQIGAGCLR